MLKENIFTEQHFKEFAESESGETKTASFVNPYNYYKIIDDWDIFREVDSYYADGIFLVWSVNVFNKSKIDRVSFDYTSIAHWFLSYASDNKKSVLMVGGNSSEARIAEFNIRERHPGIFLSIIPGYESIVPFAKVAEIGKNYDYIILGLGSPLQELKTIELKRIYPKGKKIITCGGFISQTAIKSDYYHPLVKKFGIRWLQRFCMHSHVRRRILKDYPVFAYRFFIKND